MLLSGLSLSLQNIQHQFEKNIPCCWTKHCSINNMFYYKHHRITSYHLTSLIVCQSAIVYLCWPQHWIIPANILNVWPSSYSPREEAKTTPKPTASGPPMFRNFSLGAHMATVERPPTMPAVYQAARSIRGPPSSVKGATTAPITPAITTTHTPREWSNQCTILHGMSKVRNTLFPTFSRNL